MQYIINESSTIVSTPKKVKSTKSKVRCEVCLQTVNEINRNKRRYLKNDMLEALTRIDERVKTGSLMGELDHPIDKNPVRQVTVLYKEASHRFMEMGWDGDNLISVIETVRTPNGTILKNLAEDKIPIGFSFRGLGDVRQVTESGHRFMEVKSPLHAITWDAVSYPSHPKAQLIKVTEGVSTAICEAVGYIESDNGMIMTEDGITYFPDDFDKLVEQRIIKLKTKFIPLRSTIRS